jgi:hypothetical protein
VRFQLRSEKAQIATTDMVISSMIILIFIGIAISIMLWNTSSDDITYTYGSRIFQNIENMGTKAFITEYKVDNVKLVAFQAENYNVVKEAMLKDTQYPSSRSEVCIYFDDKGLMTYVAGQVYDSITNAFINCPIANPCNEYRTTNIAAKPVLFGNKMINALVFVCRN